MFTHMLPIHKEVHTVRNTDYEIVVYQVQETEEYRIFVVKVRIPVKAATHSI